MHRSTVVRALFVAVVLSLAPVDLAGCRPGHRLGALSSDVPKCDATPSCPFGYECAGGQCHRSECNATDPNSTIGPRECPRGVCEYDDSEDAAHGNGVCSAGL